MKNKFIKKIPLEVRTFSNGKVRHIDRKEVILPVGNKRRFIQVDKIVIRKSF
jgi:hypothetical protein